MPSDIHKPFQIFGLTLYHHLSSIRIGTDAVLLSAAIRRYATGRKVLDVGCGCGIIGLSFIEKYPHTHLTGIDIHCPSVDQALENSHLNRLHSRTTFVCTDYQSFSSNEKFDLIVSNPPFYHKQLKSPQADRNAARHNDESLPYEVFFETSSKLSEGTVALIVPFTYRSAMYQLAVSKHFHLFREIVIHSKPSSGTPIRIILFFTNQTNQMTLTTSDLIIRREDNAFTDEYLQFVYQS